MELVMTDGPAASADLAPLRAAQARRLLRMLGERAGRSPIVRRLAELARTAPEFAREVLLDPTVAVSIETGRDGAAVLAIGVALARADRLGSEARSFPGAHVVWSVDGGFVGRPERSLVLADGMLVVDGRRLALASLTGGVDDVAPGTTHAFPEITRGIRLALFDPNPYALDETHPDKDGNALSLGGRSVDAWLEGLRRAFALVERHLPGIAAEMQQLLRLVIPVGASDERHLSASYREYVGAIYLTLHRDPATMAEALVHEFQHNKLNLLACHYPILENGYDCLYRSPVRPDPRPLMGILLAAHAFVPVAELHKRLAAAETQEYDAAFVRRRLSDVVARNEEALAVLGSHAVAAPAGRLLLDRLASLHAAHRAMALELPENVSHVA